MKRLIPLALLALCACGSPTLLPDGGRPTYGCHPQTAVLAVKVVDAANQPVNGATVTAINLGTGQTATLTTDGDGVTRGVTDAMGPGIIRVEATSAGRSSPAFDTTWTCDSCTCTVQPLAAVLVVQ